MSFPYESDEVFCKIVPFVLHVEGGYCNLEGDEGGPTKYGIAYNFNAGALHKLGITRDTMRSLTLEQAKQLYYDRYMLASGANNISDDGLAFMHLDCAVNCGITTARNMLAKLSKDPKNFDGRGDANEVLFLRLVIEYTAARLNYYTNVIRKNLRVRFLEGWNNRTRFVMLKASELV